jgi:NNP family nitrate/nitrite transporter-like MFS transporter
MSTSDSPSTPPGTEPAGNSRVLWIAFVAFSLGFGIWGMFAALGPFLIKWYNFTPSQALFLAAMPPLFATITSIPLGIAADRYGGRKVFTILLFTLLIPLIAALFADSYFRFLLLGMMLGLGGASFVVGNAHVSVWYPQAKQGTALGIFSLGNIGIALGMVFVPLLIVNVLGGPEGYAELPPKFAVGPLAGWRLIFLIFAVPTLIMGFLYWTMTSEPTIRHRKLSWGQIAGVYKSGSLVWVIAFLYWTSFGTLTFFSAFTPTYLVDRWEIDGTRASMIYTSGMVVFVAIMRPIGGWLSDRLNPRNILICFFGLSLLLASVLVAEISFSAQIGAIFSLALLSGASAACVVKLIPTYFTQVGTVSGLAKAAGAACGFTMSTIMAISKNASGSYKYGFLAWAVMNILALVFVLSPKIFNREKV